MAKPFIVRVRPISVDAEPSLTVYSVMVEGATAQWPETFGSAEQVRAFVRGVRAAASFFGCFGVEVMDGDRPTTDW